jgi:hypothetical protein
MLLEKLSHVIQRSGRVFVISVQRPDRNPSNPVLLGKRQKFLGVACVNTSSVTFSGELTFAACSVR